MIDELKDVKKLTSSIKGTKKSFRQAIVDYYRELGESLGFQIIENPSALANALEYGRFDLAWYEPETVFVIEFAKQTDLMAQLFNIMSVKPKAAVLVVSSNSQINLSLIKKMTKHTPELNKTEFLLVDVGKAEII